MNINVSNNKIKTNNGQTRCTSLFLINNLDILKLDTKNTVYF